MAGQRGGGGNENRRRGRRRRGHDENMDPNVSQSKEDYLYVRGNCSSDIKLPQYPNSQWSHTFCIFTTFYIGDRRRAN